MLGLIPFRLNNGEKNTGVSLDNLFNDFFNDSMTTSLWNSAKETFKTDIKETPEEYMIHAELPGVKKEDITMDYSNNYLTISAVRNEEKEEKNNKYIRKERSTGEVSRAFYLDNIDENSINAKFENGVLTVKLPKKEVTPKEIKKISIE